MKKLFLIIIAIIASMVSSAHASWGSRCNPQEAKKLYVCFLVNCPLVTSTLGLTTDAYVSGALSGTSEKLMPQLAAKADQIPRDYGIWQQLDQQGKKVDLQLLRKLDNFTVADLWINAPRLLATIKSVPIDDYHCQMTLTFDEKALAEASQSIVIAAMLAKPLVNPLAFMLIGPMLTGGDTSKLTGILNLQGQLVAQNFRRSIVYTEGLDLQAEDVYFNVN